MRWLVLLFWLLPVLATAQGAATLVADTVQVDRTGRLIATGNVEVYYDGTRMLAGQITFDRATDRLEIAGPIVITGADGEIVTASAASLDPRLQNGLLQSARLVLNQQLQLAAVQIDRSEGRYSQLYKVAATSCQVCGNQAPLWDIRAERVVHDQTAQQIYFTNAVLRLRGVPVFWLPRMRLPDPTLDRATGFLIPRLRTTDQLGTGIKTPYFIRLGNSRDLTLTPYLSAKTTTLEARYRQALPRGEIEINLAASNDSLEPDRTRAYVFADGHYDLGGDLLLTFGLQAASDDAYLVDYGYAAQDRLESQIALTRVRTDDLLQASLSQFRTLRVGEDDEGLPPYVASFSYERLIQPGIGGDLRLGASADGFVRTGDAIGDAGRDLARIGVAGDYRRRWVLAGGVVADARAGLALDLFRNADDPAYPQTVYRGLPGAAVTLSYPLVRQTAGARHLLTPTLALTWSEVLGDTPPNEDSTRPELDAANLFAASRLAGQDATETGLRTALGATWTRVGAGGVRSTLTFGRIYRTDAVAAFTAGTGLDGLRSDWLVDGQITLPDGISLAARSIVNDDLSADMTTGRIGWAHDDVSLAAAYIWQIADPAQDRPDPVSEWSLDTAVQISDAFKLSVDTRYDIARDRPAKAGLGLQWRNECVVVDLSVSRVYANSTSVDPTTDFGLAVTLSGFSAGRAATGPMARCN